MISWNHKIYLCCLVLCQAALFSQDGEIIPITSQIGTMVDAEENRYYEMFTDIRGFKSAQFYEVGPNEYIARIVFVEYSTQRTTKRRFSLRQFSELQNRLKGIPPITDAFRDQVKDDFTYLHTVDIIEAIPVDQYVVIDHRDGKKIRGTLLTFDEKHLRIQTPSTLIPVPVWQMNKISYRPSIIDRSPWDKYFMYLSAGLGVGLMEVWNDHRHPEIDRIWFNRFTGLTVGIVVYRELKQIGEILLTPKTEFALTPEDQKSIELYILKKFKVLN